MTEPSAPRHPHDRPDEDDGRDTVDAGSVDEYLGRKLLDQLSDRELVELYDRVDFYEAAAKRMRDKAEVATVREARAIARAEQAEAERDTASTAFNAATLRAEDAQARAAHADDYAVRQQQLVNRIHDHARTMRPADATALWRAMGGPAGGPRKLTPAQEETAYRIRAAASTVVQARRWARRARQAEAAIARVRTFCDDLDASFRRLADDPATVHPVAENIRHRLAEPQEPRT
ncbi:hypothetical protein ABT024_07035 [Streptomyces sp. NPDC002812]|uniref:hypothetical protein n=1 Tax=Streptomyces sp. NPDC002812 TaxID=3154434 RepID=UPI0033272F12